ncbi:MAG: hypothetical protein KAT46_05005 [Deltaproteobacteria bacterium]|nr:hypothetical protein [Deltaproteobacteria bacterium]
MKKMIVFVVLISVLIIAVKGFYHNEKTEEKPLGVFTYQNIADRDQEIKRLEVLSNQKNFSWQDAYSLGILYLHSLRLSEAQKTLTLGTELRPKNFKIREALGMAFFRDGKYSEATKSWYLALEISPEATHLQDMIERASEASAVKSRIAILEKIVEGRQVEWTKHFELAILYVKIKQLEKAEKTLLLALKEKDDSPDLFDGLAEIYVLSGNLEKAIINMKKALALAPDNEVYKERLSRMELQLSGVQGN